MYWIFSTQLLILNKQAIVAEEEEREGEGYRVEMAGEMEKINDASLPANKMNTQLSQMSFSRKDHKKLSEGFIIG